MRRRNTARKAAGVLAAALAVVGIAAADLSAPETERFLREADIVSMKEIGSGITKPKKVTLLRDGRTMHAAFKTVDVHHAGMTQFADGKKEIGFTDDYRYEVAAYRIDRRLGLNMVPVTVLRTIEGEEGALTEWVEDAESEAERMSRDPSVPEGLRRQHSEMRLFDALIGNVDRHGSNQLVTADGKLHLIDHSRCFRRHRKLPKPFAATPTGASADLVAQLRTLQLDELREMLGDLLSPAQITAIVHRRDRILAKVDEDVREYGESVILW